MQQTTFCSLFFFTKSREEGERGVIFGNRGAEIPGHVFNVMKKDTKLIFVDGQSGTRANLEDGFISFKYLVTTKKQ
ncbi:toxin glutamine deamidase domain-containing protein [Chryseobacterium oleae]|uniref:toxin glutamine deamidase domain-containing protein n=1 Tax=Chryseobacterium oleae TaxID=491207 RepID=UPI000B7FA7B1